MNEIKLKPQSVAINEREYIVTPFNAREAHSFLHDLIELRRTGKNSGALFMEVLRQCIAADGKQLFDGSTFDSWFNEHPGDMIPLEMKAIDILCEPWESAGKADAQLNPEKDGE